MTETSPRNNSSSDSVAIDSHLHQGNLYFDQKAHDPDLDRPQRRDEFARVTEGYSPAMIDQALSLALMYAFENGREAFNWKDLREAMNNIWSSQISAFRGQP